MKGRWAWLALSALLAPAAASAHPLAPALIELTEVAPARYAVLWRTSVARVGSAAVEPRLPTACERRSQPEPVIEAGEALVARWVVQCASGGIEGATLAVEGLEGSGINVIVRVRSERGEFRALLGADRPAVTVSLAQPEPVFGRYLRLGAEHLAGGVDHLLFVLGLFLLAPGLRALLALVTAFTAGHSLTLGLVTLGFVPLRQDLAEVLVAATVLALGVELARRATGVGAERARSGFASWQLAGGFGLIHGLGFAGALRDTGLAPGELPLSLLGFNLGIELAQIALVLLLVLAARLWRAVPLRPRLVPLLPAYLTGTLAACWLLERFVALAA